MSPLVRSLASARTGRRAFTRRTRRTSKIALRAIFFFPLTASERGGSEGASLVALQSSFFLISASTRCRFSFAGKLMGQGKAQSRRSREERGGTKAGSGGLGAGKEERWGASFWRAFEEKGLLGHHLRHRHALPCRRCRCRSPLSPLASRGRTLPHACTQERRAPYLMVR